MGNNDGQDIGNSWVWRNRDRGPDLCISAPGRRAARMPGTGPLRRSSATARIKALVRKSRFRAAAQRSPGLSFFPADVADHKMLGLLDLALRLLLRARRMGSAAAGSNRPIRS